jgi:hypothetical protein
VILHYLQSKNLGSLERTLILVDLTVFLNQLIEGCGVFLPLSEVPSPSYLVSDLLLSANRIIQFATSNFTVSLLVWPVVVDEVILPDSINSWILRLLWLHPSPFRRLDLDGLGFRGFTSFR